MSQRQSLPSQRRGGGLWRAFVRHKSLGQAGRPCLASLARDFEKAKQERDPVLLHLQQMCRSAKTGKLAGKRGGSFGHTSQQMDRASVRKRREQVWKRTHSLPAGQRAMALATEAAEYGNTSVLTLARRHVALDGANQSTQRAHEREVLKRFAHEQGKQQLQTLAATLPGLPILGELQPMPSTLGDSFWWGGSAHESAAKAVAFAHACSRSNVAAALEKEWMERHSSIMVGDCQTLPEDPKNEQKCWKFGVCLCSTKGRLTARLRARLLQHLKQTFVAGKKKDSLAGGECFMQLKRKVACIKCSSLDVETEHWWHIAAMSFSPYKPTFHVMALAASVHDSAGTVVVGHKLQVCQASKQVWLLTRLVMTFLFSV
eukprot:2904746-Amphidinium_carterae.2